MVDVNLEPMDEPIESSSRDRLGRSELAHDFARDIRTLDVSKGAVVGVLGPWGSGKSSFINLMREQFTEAPSLTVIDFNPWMFSGTEQLVDHFFVELASKFSQLQDDRLTKAAGFLEEYGQSISSIAGLFGIWGQVLAGGVGFAKLGAKRRLKSRGSAGEYHDKVTQELSGLKQPVIVVIDDIDRLTTPEIRDIFKLVRLTASFPNLIYILAFDRVRVEAALDEEGVPGRQYLEKIIQIVFDLPEISNQLLMGEVLNELHRIMEGVDNVKFDDSRWSDIFLEIIYPLIGNMRDIVRLGISARQTLRALATEVESVDLLAMEAIRVFRPEIFGQLRRMRAALTQTRTAWRGAEKDPAHQSEMAELLNNSGSDVDLVRALLERVFPGTNNSYGSEWVAIWRRKHRLACPEYLDLYFDRVAPSGLQSFRAAESLVAVMEQPGEFKSRLERVTPEILPDVLGAMESFTGDFPETGMDEVIATLLDAIPRIPADPKRTGGLLALPPEIMVLRVILRMVEQIEEKAPRETLVASAFSQVRSYSSKLKFVHSIGHRENIGSKIVSEGTAKKLENDLANEIAISPPNEYSIEWDLARVFDFIAERSEDPAVLAKERRPEAVRAIFESVKSEHRAQSLGSRYIRSTPVLAWDWLVTLYGGESNVKSAVEALREVDGDSELVKLAESYLKGWRPDQDD